MHQRERPPFPSLSLLQAGRARQARNRREIYSKLMMPSSRLERDFSNIADARMAQSTNSGTKEDEVSSVEVPLQDNH